MTLKHLLYLPPFGELSNPRLLADLAAEAEAAGWQGFFLWDHVLRPRDQAIDIADPWICLAAVAMTTSRIRIGPLVTPLTRRRPIKLAREIGTLDHLSDGRLTVGFGLGVDSGGELTRFGEEADPKIRAERLDEGLTLIDGWLSNGLVHHHGTHFTSDDVLFGPRPVQSPRPPFWFAVRGTAGKPARRAAKYEGIFPIEMDLDGVKRLLELIHVERGSLDNFDVVVWNKPTSGTVATETQMERAGATWLAHQFDVNTTASVVRAYIAANPRNG
jgi:alkanesulfonate monooxygenase SsuD/methylene tetrahydromethanopterin reductase-like flavin-dependent oxidoreductase (luciferase family)